MKLRHFLPLATMLTALAHSPAHANDSNNLNLKQRFDDAQLVLRLRPARIGWQAIESHLDDRAPAQSPSSSNTPAELLAHLEMLRLRSPMHAVGLPTGHYAVELYEVAGRIKLPTNSSASGAALTPIGITIANKEYIAMQVLRSNAGNAINALDQPEFLAFLHELGSLPKPIESLHHHWHNVRSYLESAKANPQIMPNRLWHGDTVLINTLTNPSDAAVTALAQANAGSRPQPEHPMLYLTYRYSGSPTWLNASTSSLTIPFTQGLWVDPKDCRKVTVYRYATAANAAKYASLTLATRFLAKNAPAAAPLASLTPLKWQTYAAPLEANQPPNPKQPANGFQLDYAQLTLPECGWVQLHTTQNETNGSRRSDGYWYNTQAQ